MKDLSRLYSDTPTTVFAVMSALANEHGAINLGQGFPDTDGPAWVRDIAAQALQNGPNQYPPMIGIPALREAVAAANKRFYNLDFNPQTEVLVTSGATEAIADCCAALLNPGDEAIVIEPYYDSYPAQIRAVGGVPKFVRLSPPEWELNEAVLRAAFTEKTKFILLNSPLNPAGKVFSLNELALIARLLEEFDAYAVCDEVYEHLLFDNLEHIPLMTLPGMRERCLRIGSAGKTFSLTGWKVGYVSGPARLIKAVTAAHQYTTFTTCPALQMAVAKGIAADDSYYAELVNGMDGGRKYLRNELAKCGFNVLPCDGTYFLTVDFTDFAKRTGFSGSDYDFCRFITEHAKVAAIPLSVFYANDNGTPPQNLIRFCFAKKHEVLAEAVKRLNAFLNK